MSKIKDENYYQVNGWMLNRLKLKGTALQVYAIIYGFTQDGESVFNGSLQYLMDFTNASKPTIIKALTELVEKGYLLKAESRVNGVQFVTYRADLQVVDRGSKETLPLVKKLDQGGKETLPGGSKETLLGGSKETLPNNNILDKYSSDNKTYKRGRASVSGADYSQTSFSDDLVDCMEEWFQYKAERREKYMPRGQSNLIAQVQNYVNNHGEEAIMARIRKAMAGNWVGMNLEKIETQAPKVHKAPSPEWGGRNESKDAAMQSDVDDLEKLLASVGVKV